MIDPVATWHGEHMRFIKLLDFVDQQMIAFHDGQHPDYELIRDVVYYLRHFADRYHHPSEDVAFERLIERVPGLRIQLNRLSQEHRVIAEAGESLLGLLDDILNDTVIQRATVEAAAATYLVYYRHHIAAEDTEVLPHAVKSLTADDWAAVAAAVPSIPDPLFGDDVDARYRGLRKQIMGTA